MQFYTAEANGPWEKTAAKTLRTAKAAARRRQSNCGAILSVAVSDATGRIEKVAFTVSGEWVDCHCFPIL